MALSKRDTDQRHLEARITRLSARIAEVAANSSARPQLLDQHAGPISLIDPPPQDLTAARDALTARIVRQLRPDRRARLRRADLAKIVSAAVSAYVLRNAPHAHPVVRRDLVTAVMRDLRTWDRAGATMAPESIIVQSRPEPRPTLDMMAANGTLSPAMATVLKIAAICQLNILITGTASSGKTTLLNAILPAIHNDERIVVIEYASELLLEQPHFVRFDVSALNLAKGTAELTVRDLIKSALLLAPKRIIVGECRGAEVLDLLQTANTGPEGWLATLNAPTPRDALSKLEALTRIADATLPPRAMRTQIASGMDLICHIERMQDGVHRIVQITEVIGMEDDAIRLEDLFTYEASATGPDSRLRGDFASSGVQPVFVSRAERYGLDRTLLELTGLN